MPTLYPRDIAVLTALLDAPDGVATIPQLMDATGLNHETVRRGIRSLIRQGRVVRAGVQRIPNGRWPDCYVLRTTTATEAAAA